MGCWRVYDEKIRLFRHALAESDAEDGAKIKFDYERRIRENDRSEISGAAHIEKVRRFIS